MTLVEQFSDKHSHKTPVLMVPGAFCSGKVWQHNFVPYFLSQGHPVYTMTFRGHGQPRLSKARMGLDDYLQDLREAIDQIGEAPLVIAHSLGGLTTLRLLTEMALPAAALVSPVPLSGLGRMAGRTLFGDPLSALKWVGLMAEPKVRYLGAPPRGIYSNQVLPEYAEKVTAQLNSESILALMSLLKPQNVDIEAITSPIKIIAATGDCITPIDLIEDTATMLQAPLSVYEGISHSVQAEPEWETIADEIKAWFYSQTVPHSRTASVSASASASTSAATS